MASKTSSRRIKLVNSNRVSTGVKLADLSRDQLEQEILKLRKTLVTMQSAVSTEPVSVLLKKSFFLERANEEFQRSRRYDRELALVVITLLDAGSIKQSNGQQAFDYYISGMAQKCVSACRQGADILGRVNEAQFAILLPESDLSGCTRFKERLRSELAASEISHDGKTLKSGMKVSAGVLLKEDQSFGELFQRTITQQPSIAKRKVSKA